MDGEVSFRSCQKHHGKEVAMNKQRSLSHINTFPFHSFLPSRSIIFLWRTMIFCLVACSVLSAGKLEARGKKLSPREQLEERAKENSEGEFHLFSPFALLIDGSTGEVLFEKNADEPMDPSSMSKIMTVYMVFDKLKRKELSLDTRLPVSEKAWRMQGSKTFVELGSDIRIEDLLRGIIVQSGNDACIVVAEGLAGSEGAFAQKMNEKAKELGALHTHLTNATGWADPEHKMSARDLALIAQRTINDFPEYYSYYKETEFVYSGIKQGNRNPLLYASMGADGLKTGHTDEGGFGLVASAVQNGRRLIVVINGANSLYERERDAKILMGWGFREFKNVVLANGKEPIGMVSLEGGVIKEIPAMTVDPVVVTVRGDKVSEIQKNIVLKPALKAPIAAGQEIGELQVILPDGIAKAWPLVSGLSVEALSWWGRLVVYCKSFF